MQRLAERDMTTEIVGLDRKDDMIQADWMRAAQEA
jgi:hypothetical protein